MSVKCEAHQNSYAEGPMTGLDGLPSQEDEKSRQGFWPGIDGLANKIRIGDVEKRGQRQTRLRPQARTESNGSEKQQRIEDQANNSKLFEVAIRIEFRNIRPVAAKVIKTAEF